MRKFCIETLLLLAVSAVVIFYQFPRLPVNLARDEVEFARLALSLEKTGYIPYSSFATGHSTLYFYILLFFLKLVGISNFALRLPSALFGVLGGVVFYLLMKKVFQKPPPSFVQSYLPIGLAILFVSMRWYFNFARFAFEGTFLLFLELVSIYFLFIYREKRKPLFAFCSAIFAGLAFHSYTPGRIFFILPFLWIALGWGKVRIRVFIISYLMFLLVIFPLFSYLSIRGDSRIDEQSFLTSVELTLKDKTTIFKENIKRVAYMFHVEGDMNGRHNYPQKPALNIFMGLLFIVGLFIALYRYRKFPNLFFIAYFLLSLGPSLLTHYRENPHMLRTFTAIPSVVYFAGLALQCILHSIQRMCVRAFILGILLYMLILSSLYELRTYFLFQKNVFYDSFEVPYSIENALKLE
ncbi:MAG TPA: glycosyltransferase family 39 protein [Patescibacteria group bacterium]|nr:glycosyltransferase family 39 protein [Patescibacteria group bacterium]